MSVEQGYESAKLTGKSNTNALVIPCIVIVLYVLVQYFNMLSCLAKPNSLKHYFSLLRLLSFFMMKASKLFTVVTKTTIRTDWTVKCWIIF